MVRMRTIPQIVQELRQQDPQSPISEYFLRKLVKQNKIPHVTANSRVYIPLDEFMECMKKSNAKEGYQ